MELPILKMINAFKFWTVKWRIASVKFQKKYGNIKWILVMMFSVYFFKSIFQIIGAGNISAALLSLPTSYLLSFRIFEFFNNKKHQ